MNKQNRADVTCRDTGTDSSFLPGQITPLSARRMGLGRRGGREKKANVGKGGKKYPAEKLAGGSAGARRLCLAPAYSSRTLLTARAGDE